MNAMSQDDWHFEPLGILHLLQGTKDYIACRTYVGRLMKANGSFDQLLCIQDPAEKVVGSEGGGGGKGEGSGKRKDAGSGKGKKRAAKKRQARKHQKTSYPPLTRRGNCSSESRVDVLTFDGTKSRPMRMIGN